MNISRHSVSNLMGGSTTYVLWRQKTSWALKYSILLMALYIWMESTKASGLCATSAENLITCPVLPVKKKKTSSDHFFVPFMTVERRISSRYCPPTASD